MGEKRGGLKERNSVKEERAPIGKGERSESKRAKRSRDLWLNPSNLILRNKGS